MRAVAVLLFAALCVSACGGGGGSKSTASSTGTTATSPPPSSSTPIGTSPKAKAPETPSTTSTSTSGGSTPAHFDAALMGRGGRITPSSVAVVPFIAVRVLLKSGDGQRYSLSVNGKTLAAHAGSSGELTLPGLKPGQSYVLRQPAGGKSVKITANAEPGP
jgi:hypothetical protein